MSGCRPNASCGARTSSPVAPEQWPTSRPGRTVTARAAAAISASGTHSSATSAPAPSKPRPNGPRTGRPAALSAPASARPRRPRPTIAIVLSISRSSPLSGVPVALLYPKRSGSRPPGRPLGSACAADEGGAPRGAQGRLPPGEGLHELPAARRHPHDRRVRQRQRRRGPDVRGRGARRERGPPGSAVRRASGEAAGHAARGDRAGARGRVRGECLEVPPARQPRPAPGRDRGVPVVPAPAGRAHRAPRHLHTRQLRDEAAAGRADRDHPAPRPRRGPRHRPARRAAVSALPPGRRALHAGERRGAAGRLRAHPRSPRARPAAAARAVRGAGRADRGGRPARAARARTGRGRAAARGAARAVLMVHDAAARGFARSADAYDRARPDYPDAAIAWLAERLDLRPGRTVVDLAAGTGKLTRPLAATGATVVAIEPVAEMRARVGGAAERALDGTAEAMPLPEESADAVAVGQAFHWFDGAAALAEIHRVLRPGGALALIWNRRPLDHPVHAAIARIIEPYRGDAPAHRSGDWRTAFAATTRFGPLEERTFDHARPHDADALADRVGSTSFVAALDDGPQAEVIAAVRALAADGPVDVPYVCEVMVCDGCP